MEEALQERPAATLSERREYLRSVAGLRVSESTVSGLLRRMGWSRKKIGGSGGARRVLETLLRKTGARTREALMEAMGRALDAVTGGGDGGR